MTRKKVGELSPKGVERANRQRLAAEKGTQAMADVARNAIAIRKNMERLRALREAKEAADAAAQPDVPPVVAAKTKKSRKIISK